MKPVTIYTKAMCPYCARAMKLLKQKNAEVTEIAAGFDKEKKEEMIQRANGARTFPQIFIGDEHVGGSDELAALEREGKLDTLLAA